MTEPDRFRIATLAALRDRIGEPNPVTRQKIFDGLGEQMRAYLARSPFCLLATTDPKGNPEVSPKGDAPGFTLVVDDRTLVVPDRKGNKLLFGLENLLANPRIALIFLQPGTDETLRVSGSASPSGDRSRRGSVATRFSPNRSTRVSRKVGWTARRSSRASYGLDRGRGCLGER